MTLHAISPVRLAPDADTRLAESSPARQRTLARNLPLLAIARRIGFSSERRYDLVACHAPLA